MACRQIFVIAVLFVFRNIYSQQCGIDTYSFYQMMLKGHTFKTFKARPLSLDCRETCNSDVRCQSYNYVMFKDICELNNRTKEARPEDFIKDRDRYYIAKAPNRGNTTCKMQQLIILIQCYCFLHLGRKYAGIFVRGHYLIQGQISEHIFFPNGGHCLYYLSNIFKQGRLTLETFSENQLTSNQPLHAFKTFSPFYLKCSVLFSIVFCVE